MSVKVSLDYIGAGNARACFGDECKGFSEATYFEAMSAGMKWLEDKLQKANQLRGEDHGQETDHDT